MCLVDFSISVIHISGWGTTQIYGHSPDDPRMSCHTSPYHILETTVSKKYLTRKPYGLGVHMHTTSLFEKHALEENMLSVCTLVADTYRFVTWTKPLFNNIHCLHTIWTKANSGAFNGEKENIRISPTQLDMSQLTPRQSTALLLRKL